MSTTVLSSSTLQPSTTDEQRKEEFFEKLFSNIRADKIMLDTGTAPENVKNMYDILIQEDTFALAVLSKNIANWTLTKKAVLQYLQYVLGSEHRPKHIAFDNSNASLMVWAVVADNDEAAEDTLYIAEAKVNNALYEAGYKVSTTVVEESDRLPVPDRYQDLALPTQA